MTKKHKKIKILPLVITILLVGGLSYGVLLFIKGGLFKVNKEEAYLSSAEKEITLYDLEYKEATKAVRGSKVQLYEESVIQENEEKTEYRKIEFNNKEYLVMPADVAIKYEDSVKEETLYVRTPVTVYKTFDDVSILGLIKKGEEVKITGFDEILEDGSVKMYKVIYGEAEGYIYSKYLVNTKEEADINYDYNGNYQTHASRGNRFGGGTAQNLDYYPVEKGNFEDNVMPTEVRSLYLNSGVLGNIDEYIKIAKASNINAFVVDIKDNTAPGYASEVMKEYSPTNYNNAVNSLDVYQAAIKKLKDEGFYVIGRITTFKDSYYVNDHPETAITSTSTGKPYSHNGSYWPSAYSRQVWEFNVRLAIEAVKLMGFNEIQFDYVRFPDRTMSIENSGAISFNNTYGESKAQAIQEFLMYACDELHKYNAYVSVDVFGEAANTYVTAYGQYWAAISNIVDVISAMPYPDHFNTYEYGFTVPVWTIPYQLLNTWGKTVMQRQSETASPAITRTWIQAYNAIKSPYITYDAYMVSEEIKGLYDAGLTGGYMTWNGTSNTSKYWEISSAFKKDYLR